MTGQWVNTRTTGFNMPVYAKITLYHLSQEYGGTAPVYDAEVGTGGILCGLSQAVWDESWAAYIITAGGGATGGDGRRR